MKNKTILSPALFLLVELIAYILILTSGGDLLIYSSFGAILLCFLYACFHKSPEGMMLGGLGCTVLADFCLVICTPAQRLWGMVFFLIAQTLYAIRLHRLRKDTGLLIARLVLIIVIETAALLILKKKTDALALVSVCYYIMLVMNVIHAFKGPDKLLAVGFVLFLLCDTIIGLQVANGVYLTIRAGSLLHKIIYMPFNLSWFFYLPAQVIIALRAKKA